VLPRTCASTYPAGGGGRQFVGGYNLGSRFQASPSRRPASAAVQQAGGWIQTR
jgi:hypothetical protein